MIAAGMAAVMVVSLAGCRPLRNLLQSVNNTSSPSTAASTTVDPNDYGYRINTGQGGGVYNSDVQQTIDAINNAIDQNYYFEDADDATKTEYLYKGLVESLGDRYSKYYTAEEFQAELESDSGSYTGIGISFSSDTGMIMDVFDHSGAQDAGILPKDVLKKVDDIDVTADNLENLYKIIRGTEGTTTDVTVYRPSTGETLTFTCQRKLVTNYSVKYEMIQGNIGYVKVKEFDELVADNFAKAIADLQSQGMKSMIIDMRDNPGGYVYYAADMCDQIIPSGNITTLKDRDGNIMEEYNAQSDRSLNIPIIVLLNENSASATELMAGCLQDHGVAKVVGTQSFGKGIVQDYFTFDDGSAVKLTVGRYFTPNGECIHEVGITPDIVVELPQEAMYEPILPPEMDTQLSRAIEELGGTPTVTEEKTE